MGSRSQLVSLSGTTNRQDRERPLVSPGGTETRLRTGHAHMMRKLLRREAKGPWRKGVAGSRAHGQGGGVGRWRAKGSWERGGQCVVEVEAGSQAEEGVVTPGLFVRPRWLLLSGRV